MSARQAAHRLSRHSVDWSRVAGRLTSAEMGMYRAFKAKSDAYVNRVASLPEQPPKIDWDHYKQLTGQSQVIDNLRQAYEGLKIDYPGDQGRLTEIDAEEKDTRRSVEDLRQEVKELKVEAQDALQRWEAMPPLNTLTHEEAYISFPDQFSYMDDKIEPFAVFDADAENPEGMWTREAVMTPEERADWRKRANEFYELTVGPAVTGEAARVAAIESAKHKHHH